MEALLRRPAGRAAARLVAMLALVAAAMLALTGAAGASERARAALVVQAGEAVRSICVDLGADSASGKEVVERSGLEQRWDGGALCRLDGTGPARGGCFSDYPEFWGLWVGDGQDGWEWSGSGAATTTVRDGDVQAWTWGTGQDGGNHPRPPVVRFEEVCAAGAGAAPAATGDAGSVPVVPAALAGGAALALLGVAWWRRRSGERA